MAEQYKCKECKIKVGIKSFYEKYDVCVVCIKKFYRPCSRCKKKSNPVYLDHHGVCGPCDRFLHPKPKKKRVTNPGVCSRCDGKGRMRCYNHVMGGVCFKCGGSGK